MFCKEFKQSCGPCISIRFEFANKMGSAFIKLILWDGYVHGFDKQSHFQWNLTPQNTIIE